MWDKLAAQVALELEQLEQLLNTYRPLLEECVGTPPDDIQLAALAAMLHSFYNGVENLLKRIALETGEGLPSGNVWHRKLLDQMSAATAIRPAVLTPDLRSQLRPYLDFRHVFRHAYTFDLHWDKMKGLVLHCEETLESFQRALERLLREGRRD